MEELWIRLLNMSIMASFVIAAILLLRALLHRAPRWILCLFWIPAALRLIFPLSFESVFSLIPSAQTVPKEILFSETPTISSGLAFVNSAVNPVLQGSLTPAPFASINPMQVVIFALALIWLIGVIALFSYAAISSFRLWRTVRFAVSAEKGVKETDRISSPFVFGVFHPTIYLPIGLEKTEREHILAHERAHIHRRDYLWKPLGFVIFSIYWMNPIIFLAYLLLCRDIELACDEAVVRTLSTEEKKAYAHALLHQSSERRGLALCPLAFGEVGVKTRVKSVLHDKRPAFWLIAAALVACVFLGLCFLTNPKTPKDTKAPVSFSKDSTYAFDACLYQNPLSSYYPLGGTGLLYSFTENGFLTQSEETGEIRYLTSMFKEERKTLTKEEWEAMFIPGSNIPALGTKEMITLSTEYRLLVGDGEVWLVNLSEKETGKAMIWSVYRLKLAEKAVNLSGTETTAGYADLETAVSKAILAENGGKNAAGTVATEAHTTFKVVEDENTATVYAMVLSMNLSKKEGALYDEDGGHFPVALTFEKKEGLYTLAEYWIPMDGSGYAPSIREKFPADIADQAMDTQRYIEPHIRACYEEAVNALSIDTDAVLSELVGKILRTDADSEEQELFYREMRYYGNFTLGYAFSHFEKEDLTPKEDKVLLKATRETLGGMDIKLDASTGKEWYTEYKMYAERMLHHNEADFIKTEYPELWLLLEVAGEV